MMIIFNILWRIMDMLKIISIKTIMVYFFIFVKIHKTIVMVYGDNGYKWGGRVVKYKKKLNLVV